MREKAIRRMNRRIQKVYQVIKISTRSYISFNEMKSSIKNILKTLQKRYKLSNVKIIKQLHDQYHTLKIFARQDQNRALNQ